MVSTRGKRGVGKGPASGTGDKEDEAAAADIQSTAEAADDGDDPVSLQPPDNPPETAREDASATGGQGADDEAQPGESAAPPASESVAANPGAEADAARSEAPETEDEGGKKEEESQETTEASREGVGASPGGGGKAPGGAPPQGGAGADKQPGAGDGGVGEASADANTPPDEKVPAKTGHGSAAVPDEGKPGPESLQTRPQGAPSAARDPGGDAMDVAEEEEEEEEEPTLVRVDRTPAVGQGDSSDEEDEDDGFRVVVGREVAPSSTPVVPTKRFLRGTNTLVNTSSAGAKESTTGSKPVSAAAGIASLVPSKGAPVATARPSLKPGEYPPTAELQQSTGRTAFDVDIDGMEEQPWRHPGVDIADFFNYGFTEDSWRVYCEKQLRNRYDRTRGRSKATSVTSGRGSTSNSSSNINNSNGNSLMRHGGGDRPARMENSLQPQRPPQAAMHGNNGPPGPNSFRPHGPAGNMGVWAGGGGGGGGPGPERFPNGFGPGPPTGHGSASPPWFDGQPQQQLPQQQMHQMRPQNRQHQHHFAPGPPGPPGGRGGGGGVGMMGPGGGNGFNGNMSNNGRMVDNPAGLRRSRSPDPRGGPLENKMARIR